MSLRTKTIGILLLVSLLTAAAIFVTSSQILKAEFSAIEQRELAENLKRAQVALRKYGEELSSKASQLAEQENIVKLLAPQASEIAQINTGTIAIPSEITNLYLLNESNELVQAFQLNKKTAAFENTLASVDKTEFSGLLDSISSTRGTLVQIGYSLYIATKVSLNGPSVGDASVKGTVVVAKAINDALVRELSDQTRVRLAILSLNQWSKLTALHGFRTPQMSETTVFAANSDLIHGFESLQDARGKNVAILQVIDERTIMQNWEHTKALSIASLLGVLVVGLLATVVLLQFSILRPLGRFQHDLRKINYRKLNGARVTVNGRNELSQLGTDINILLSALEQTHGDIENAKLLAEQANESKSLFFSALSHDIKNTVAAIKGWLETGLRKNSGPEFRRCMANAHQATSSLISSISGLLDYARVERGAIKIEPKEFAIERLLQDVRLTVSSLLRGSRVIFTIKVAPSVPNKITADQMRLQRVLTTLLSNSAKFTNHGRIALEISLAREVAGSGDTKVNFKISDTGLTIDESELNNITNPHSAEINASSRNDKASSYGLFVCNSLIQGMGGKLGITSVLGEGTTFEFSLACGAHAVELPDKVSANIAVVSRLGNDCPVFQLCGEIASQAKVFASLESLSRPADFSAIILVSQVCESIGHSELLNQIKERTILCIDMRNDQDLLEYTGRGFRSVLAGPALSSEIVYAVTHGASPATDNEFDKAIPPPVKPYRILYVDDSEINRIAPGEMLKDAGYHVSFACDGEELVSLITKQLNGEGEPYDLIVTDIFMPRMDGTIAAQNIRALEKRLGKKQRLPIVAVTGYSSDHERTQIMSYGINDVIDKPVNPQELSNAINKLLGDSPILK